MELVVSIFSEEFKRTVEKEGHSLKTFNSDDETGIPGRLPKRNCTPEERNAHGFQIATDQITVLLGEMQITVTILRNGNCIFKTLVVYQPENPGAIRGMSTSHLPVL